MNGLLCWILGAGICSGKISQDIKPYDAAGLKKMARFTPWEIRGKNITLPRDGLYVYRVQGYNRKKTQTRTFKTSEW
jgi:hypothetical protein